MSAFLRQAEQILDIAVEESDNGQDLVILIDRQGAIRIMHMAGWSVPALTAEFGSATIYKVERRAGTVRVEGWTGSQQCLLQRTLSLQDLSGLPGVAATPHAMMLQVCPPPPV